MADLRRVLACLTVLTMMSAAPLCLAGSNEITLQRFGDCIQGTTPDPDTGEVSPCIATRTRDEAFRSFANELGLAVSPLGLQPAETLGIAGFSVQFDHSVASINSDADYWSLAMVDGDAPSSLSVSTVHLRKGLPFSSELGLQVGYLWGSELATVGGELKIALLEDVFWPAPDIAIRGFGNALIGHRQLNLFTAGADVIASVPFGVAGVVQLTPFIGYNLTVVYSGSRLIDASPGDLLPPIENAENPARSNRPEYVFATESDIFHRIFAGLRVQVAAVDLTLQGTFLGEVTTVSLGVGLNF